MALAAWLWAGLARRRLARIVSPLEPLESLVDRLAAGRSFLDVGALWGVDGKIAFRAEDRGASSVTAIDVSPETPGYRAEHARRGSSVRFVCGDLHDRAVREQAGTHDVVWCAGVLYHCPNPVHTLACLRELTGRTLVLITATLPELPGVRQASVFYPGLPERHRRRHLRALDAALGGGRHHREGLSTPFHSAQGYGNWWWGLTCSAVEAMLGASGFTVIETESDGFHTRLLAQPAQTR